MSVNLQRGNLLYQQGRHADAEAEFRLACAADPESSEPHAMLALALLDLERFAEASAEAENAIGLAPDWAFAHYVLAKVLAERQGLEAAKAAIDEAIALEPYNADFHTLLAAIHLDSSRFADALASAETALEEDPENVGANNLRAMALVKLGRRAEAGETIAATLARDPENAITHANQGWTLLETGHRAAAHDHFREALRLEPNNAWAREGLVASLKAKRWFYSLLLKYSFAMSRLEPRTQGIVVFGGWALFQALRGLTRVYPTVAPFTTPLLVIYGVFVVLTWTADPIANLLLRFDREGRHTLTEEQDRSGFWIGIALGLMALTALVAFLADDADWVGGMLMIGLMLIPISAVFKCPVGWPRRTMTIFTSVTAVVGFVSWLLMLLDTGTTSAQQAWGYGIVVFLVMILVSTFLANWLSSRRPKR